METDVVIVFVFVPSQTNHVKTITLMIASRLFKGAPSVGGAPFMDETERICFNRNIWLRTSHHDEKRM